ncbi:MAG: 50S ribosomal protein L25 [Candidatus Berkelbacteria bacterium Licking1014_7]|uniref:Large ribosomal subunit protein bL25 n=1 Tax=Candidatus Berkelbacteria bacterium Licking1014_7 TaxID=2017147 RepID=A0A554LKM1_9BACT|nr:MAG: 50S ribosomal protein L25 [Candidatus Berkelbacteria bacterium Licking1014_7]
MKKTNLNATIRQEKRKRVKELIKNHYLPAILYGKGIKNQNLTIKKSALMHILKEFGQNALVNLKINDQEKILVFIKYVQKNPVNDNIVHCDFWKIDPNKKLETEIPIVAIDSAPAVEDLQGILIQSKNALEVLALPEKLVPEIQVSIANLKTFEDKIQIKDIVLPEGIETQNDPKETIFSIQEPRSEKELEELEEKPEENVQQVAVEKGKEDETGTEEPAVDKKEIEQKPDETK